MRNLLYLLLLLVPLSGYSQARYSSDTKIISNRLLDQLCDEELPVLRNEIYARHGYVFKNKELQERFDHEPWYARAASNSAVILSKIEENNVAILKKEENRRKAYRDAIATYFNKLKASASLVQSDVLAKLLNEEDADDFKTILLSTLNEVEPAKLNMCGQRGIYKKTIDNGKSTQSFFLEVGGEDIRLGTSSEGPSSILSNPRTIEEEDTFYEDTYYEESSFWFEFVIDINYKITFKQINGAG